MEDIQSLRKPSDIPPVTLAELNDYSAGNKDQWINNHKIGDSMRFFRQFNDNNIYYLATNVLNYRTWDEMIGYINEDNVFLPFYKRSVKIGGLNTEWEDYTTNMELSNRYTFFIFDLGINERADRARQARMEEETRRARMEQETGVRQARLRVAEKQGETVGLEGIELKDFSKKVGGRRTRRNKSTRRRRTLRHNSRKLNSRKLKKSRKSRKSRK
jgi:hypothetical protein